MITTCRNLDDYLDYTNLDWTPTPTTKGIFSSGWNPCHERHYNVNSPHEDTVSLTVEPRTPGPYACAVVTLIPILIPVLCWVMSSNVNAKMLTFWKDSSSNTINFTMRSKSAFIEDPPISLYCVTGIWSNNRTTDADPIVVVDMTIQHKHGMHAISVEADPKVPVFINAVEVLIARTVEQDHLVVKL